MFQTLTAIACNALMATLLYASEVEYVEVVHEGISARASVLPAGARLAMTAQILPVDENDTVAGEDDVASQLDRTLARAEKLLTTVGASLKSAARVNLYATTPEAAVEARKILAARLKCPVSAVVTALPQAGALVAVDVVAVATAEASSQPEDVQIVRSDRAVYISGMAAAGEMSQATRETLEKLGGVLDYLKIDRKDVVHVKSFLVGANDVSRSRAELAKFFGDHSPPATWVEWTMKSPIEIELVARMPETAEHVATDTITHLTPPDVKASPVYSRIALVHGGQTIFTSGVYAGASTSDAIDETRLALATLREVVKKAGGDFEHLAKATYYPATDATSAALNTVRPGFFNPQRPPAASKAPARHTGDAESKLTLDLIAVTPK